MPPLLATFLRNLLKSDTALGALVALLAFLAYLSTVSPSIGYWDSAELAAATATLGIAHPTGYPLFTLLGRAFAFLPTGLTPYHNLNLMGALLTAVAVFFVYRVILFLLSGQGQRLFRMRASTASVDPGGVGVDRLAAATAALVLAFSRTFWSEAVSLEVYALHLVFFAVVTLLFLRALLQTTHPLTSLGGQRVAATNTRATQRVAPTNSLWLLFAFVLGLSFSHHMMTVLLAPAFLALYFSTLGFGRAAWQGIVRAVPPFLLGLTPYLYLPLRAAANPAVNWGNPSTFPDFWTHVSAAQYRFKMFSSVDVAWNKLILFLTGLPFEFAVLPLLPAGAGLWILLRRGWRLALFTMLIVAACLFYAVNYDFDDPNFYLHAYVMTAVWIAFGLRAMLARTRGRATRWGTGMACALLVLLPFDGNYTRADQSANHAVEDYTRTVLASLEADALILSADLEGFVLAAQYLQLVEGVRPDVAVVGNGILAYPWYHAQLETQHPGILSGLDSERAAYLPLRRRREQGDTVNFAGYSLAFTRIVQGLLRENRPVRPLYVTSDVPPGFFGAFQAVPQGLVLRLTQDTELQAIDPDTGAPRPIPANIPYGTSVRTAYAAGYFNHALYRLTLGESEAGMEFLRQALAISPDYPPAVELMKRLQAGP